MVYEVLLPCLDYQCWHCFLLFRIVVLDVVYPYHIVAVYLFLLLSFFVLFMLDYFRAVTLCLRTII